VSQRKTDGFLGIDILLRFLANDNAFSECVNCVYCGYIHLESAENEIQAWTQPLTRIGTKWRNRDGDGEGI
jgi:hypothetical protein